MRFDKGGVVDLAQEKRDRLKYQVKTMQKRRKAASPTYTRPNPKYRDKAAKVVQHWWRELKDRYKNIISKIILIQSFWRGRWVRKYMYDILYLSCMYQSFCSTIQKQLVNHVRPKVFNKLQEGRKNALAALRRAVLNQGRYDRLLKRLYWNKWKENLSEYRKQGIKAKLLLALKKAKQDEFDRLLLGFYKWKVITQLLRARESTDDEAGQRRKYFGLVTMLNGSDK